MSQADQVEEASAELEQQQMEQQKQRAVLEEELREKVEGLLSQLNVSRRELAAAREQNAEWKQKHLALHEHCIQLTEQLEATTVEAAEWEAKCSSLRVMYEAADARAGEWEDKCDHSEADHADLATSQAAVWRSKCAELELQLQEARDAGENDSAQCQDTIRELEGRLRTAAKDRMAELDQWEREESRASTMESKIAELTSALGDAERQSVHADSSINALQTRLVCALSSLMVSLKLLVRLAVKVRQMLPSMGDSAVLLGFMVNSFAGCVEKREAQMESAPLFCSKIGLVDTLPDEVLLAIDLVDTIAGDSNEH